MLNSKLEIRTSKEGKTDKVPTVVELTHSNGRKESEQVNEKNHVYMLCKNRMIGYTEHD